MQRLFPFRCQPFNRRQRVAVGLDGKHQAGPRRLAVEEDGAGAADAVLAAYVCAGKRQLVAQKVAQQQARRNGTLVRPPVDGDTDGDSLRHGAGGW